MTEETVQSDRGASLGLAVVLAVRFLLELALLAGVVIVAWHLAPDSWKWLAALLAPAAVAAFWGLVLSPKATFPPPRTVALCLEAGLFIGVAVGLYSVGIGTAAVTGIVIWAAHRVALVIL